MQDAVGIPEASAIGVVGWSLADGMFGGYSRYTVRLVEAVHRIRPDIKVIILTDVAPAEVWKAQLSFVEWRISPSSRLYWLWVLLPRICAKEGLVSVLFPCNIGGSGITRVPSVITVHDLMTHDDLHEHRFSRPYRRSLLYWTHRSFLAFNKPAVVAVSRHTFNDLARLSCYDGLPASWAYNGVDYNFYEVAVDQSRYFLYVGNAEGHKDLPTLLKACTSVFSERPEVSMVLAGKIAVDRRHELLRVVPNGFRSRVHFRGYVGEDELKRLYRRAVAVVIPGSEGFGLSAAEALMAGRPPLVPTGSAQAEISGPLGIQYASGNPSELASRMLAVLVDQEDFSIQEARHVYAQRMFSWDQHAQHLVGVMSAVVGRSK